MTLEEQLFTAECLQHSFNISYESDDTDKTAKMNQVTFQNLLLLPPTLNDARTEIDHTWVVDYHTQAACPRCHVLENKLWIHHAHDITLSPTYHQQWETKFCDMLRNGPFEIFHHASTCAINIPTDSSIVALSGDQEKVAEDDEDDDHAPTSATNTSNAVVTGRRQVVFHVRASMDLPLDQELTEHELQFINDALRLSYNGVHHHEDVVMDRATLQQHYTVPHIPDTTKTTTMVRRSWNSNDFMDFTYIFTWEACAVCHLCALDSISNSNSTIESNITKNVQWLKSLESALQDVSKRGENEQELWETAFCNMLRHGPYETFQIVKSCYVVVYMERSEHVVVSEAISE
jgi:hypothetical protein